MLTLSAESWNLERYARIARTSATTPNLPLDWKWKHHTNLVLQRWLCETLASEIYVAIEYVPRFCAVILFSFEYWATFINKSISQLSNVFCKSGRSSNALMQALICSPSQKRVTKVKIEWISLLWKIVSGGTQFNIGVGNSLNQI